MEERIGMDTPKDLLLSKLLPALSDNPFSTVYQERPQPFVQQVEEEIKPTKQPEPPAPVPQSTMDEQLEQSIAITDDDVLTTLRSRIFSRVEEDCENYFTTNVIECVVLKHLDEAISRFNTCSCDRCRCDIVAHALNNLQPKYVVGSPRRAEMFQENVNVRTVLVALVNAVLAVRANPRH